MNAMGTSSTGRFERRVNLWLEHTDERRARYARKARAPYTQEHVRRARWRLASLIAVEAALLAVAFAFWHNGWSLLSNAVIFGLWAGSQSWSSRRWAMIFGRVPPDPPLDDEGSETTGVAAM